MSMELDTGPLSWVKGEIDLALERAGESLAAFASDPAGDGLAKARASMHQAHGALAIVGLDGITEFADGIKQLLAALGDPAVADTAAAIAAAQAGFAALRGYLDDLMAGHPDQPLKLFAPYRAMALARGQPDPGPASLFFPDLTQRPPKREKEPPPLAADALLARLKAARLGFERGLLKWLKHDPKGIAEMKVSVSMIEATRGSPASRAYWWVAIGVLDALAADGLPDADGAKRFAMRLGAHIKKLTEGQPDPDPRAMREALYQAASATAGGEQLAIVRAAYRLDDMIPTGTPSETERLLPHIRRLRELLAAAKDEWNRLCAGTAAALPPFHEHVAKIAEEGAATGQGDYQRLTAAILDTADHLRRDPSRHDETMALEIATAILLAESALENFQSLDAEFAHSTDAVVNRLAALGRGEELGMLDLPHLDAMARRAQERLLLESVAREIRSNLGAIETTLDAFFRDPSRQSTLAALQQPIRQIQGALLVLSQDRANAVLAECAAAIERFAQPGFAAEAGEFEDVAKKLSALGFFVTQLQGGAADIDAILAPPAPARQAKAAPEAAEPVAEPTAAPLAAEPPPATHAAVEPLPELSLDAAADLEAAPLAEPDTGAGAAEPLPDFEIEEVAPPPAAAPPAPPAVEAPPPSAEASRLIDASEEDLDAELLGIFLEEANEVLGTIGQQLPLLHANPGNHEALVTTRRSFHTLKGSGRMVGLAELGEAAWAVEKTLNAWLHETRPATPPLLEMLDIAAETFKAWVAQLESGGSRHLDFSELDLRCQRFGSDGETFVASPATAAVSGEAATIAEAPAPAAVEPEAAEALELAEAVVEPEVPASPPVVPELPESLAIEIPPAEAEAIESAGAAPEPAEWQAAELAPAAIEPAEPQPAEAAAADAALPEPVVPEFAEPQPVEPETSVAEPVEPEAPELEATSVEAAEPPPQLPPAEAAEPPPELPQAEPAETATAEVVAFPSPPPVRIGDVEISPTLYNLYVDECREHIATLQATLGIEAVPANETIRAAHTTASISAATGIMSLSTLARALEDALGRLALIGAVPTEAQRLVFARCAGALEGMLGAVAERRMPGEEADLTAELNAMTPAIEPVVEAPVEPVPAAPGEAAAQAAVPEVTVTAADRRATRIEDEIDEQILPLFLEESVDLMRDIGETLRAWRANPTSPDIARTLQRALHTLKGSARMAGAMGCGELLHSMEDRIDQAVRMNSVQASTIDGLEASYDRAAMLIEHLRNPDAPPPEREEPAPTPAVAAVAIEAPAAEAPQEEHKETAAPEAPAIPAAGQAPYVPTPQVHLRVRADLVDQLVNEAGEVAIARGRIEGELLALKTSMLDLTENIIRLRKQLREVEIQAESQMQSQQALASERSMEFDPLEFDRFTRFQEVTRMMAESVNDVATVQQNLMRNLDQANAAIAAQARLSRELSQRLMGVRMVPFESLAERLHRVVRQAAKDTGKRANLDIRHGQTELDRSVLDKMAGPLEHMLRNSIAHGLEDPATRAAAGKDAIGQITMSLAQEGNEIVVSISDDGAGLNFERIRKRAIDRGILSATDEPDEATLTQLIMHSGFSTAEEVTTLAGRGVGMDVVRNETASLGGRIEVSSTTGKGATFRVYLPLTLAVTQAVLVTVGNRHYAIPSSMIEQATEQRPEAAEKIRNAGGTEWLGNRYPYHYLGELLGYSQSTPQQERRHWILLVKGGTDRVALEIDSLTGTREVVVKSVGPQLARIPGLAGATVLGNGEVALIINPIALAAYSAERRATPAPTVDVAEAPVAAPAAPVAAPAAPAVAAAVMVVDDSLTVRKISGRLLARHGYNVLTAKDGVDALEQLATVLPDVMLLDIEMPRMDGFDLARSIRGDSRLKHIPLIMITSRTADKHRQMAAEIGVDHYLGKPYDEDDLLACIGDCLEKGHQSR